MNSFKYCIFNALDGTDDDTLQKDNKQNKNVSRTRKCEEDEGMDILQQIFPNCAPWSISKCSTERLV